MITAVSTSRMYAENKKIFRKVGDFNNKLYFCNRKGN